MLKLVHAFDKKSGKQIENFATEDNIAAIKKVLKTILDHRLYQTNRLRKFAASPNKNIQGNSESKLTRNPTVIRTI